MVADFECQMLLYSVSVIQSDNSMYMRNDDGVGGSGTCFIFRIEKNKEFLNII